MAKLSVLAGATSQSVNVFIRDSTSTTGGGLAAVAPAGGSLLAGTKLYYSFTGANASAGVAVSLAALATVGAAWSSAGIVTIDGTNMIGWVRIDIPNAALAAAKGRVVSFLLFGGTNMAPTPFEIELTGIDNQDATAFGMSRIDAAVSSRMATYAQPTGFLAATFPSGTVANTTNITSASGIVLAASQHVIVDSGTVTTLTNLPAITANWLTAAGIAAAALNGKGDWSTYAGGDTSGVTTLLSRIGGAITITSGGVLVHSIDTGGITAASFAAAAITSTVAPNLDAVVSSRATPTNITAATGIILGAAGLDQISVADPGIAANLTTFPKIMVWLFRRFFKRSTLTATQLKTYADDNTTVNVTQTMSDDGTTQVQGPGA